MNAGESPSFPVIPRPVEINPGDGTIALEHGIIASCHDPALEPVKELLLDYWNKATGQASEKEPRIPAVLELDGNLEEEQHLIEITDGIKIKGGSRNAVIQAIATIIQLVRVGDTPGVVHLPKVKIQDEAFAPYRGLMIDVARKKHKIKTLKRLVILCWFYKVNHLHLHLSDKQSFTFPSMKYPRLGTRRRTFSRNDLAMLVEFAWKHGVTIIPEIDIPGHSGAMIRSMPGVFKLKGAVENNGVINMGREIMYKVIDALITELCEVFTTTNWIHLGADEVNFKGIDTDPDCIEFMNRHGLDNPHELYRYFINRLNDMVKARGKTLCIWEGFLPGGKIEIPKDLIVFEFECRWNRPENLLEEGYTMVNTSWRPLYVTKRKHWTPREIYRWNMFLWRNHSSASPATLHPIQLDIDDAIDTVLGAQVCSWSQKNKVELETTRNRLPAMAERTWSVKRETATTVPSDDLVEDFMKRLQMTNDRLSKLIT